MIGTRIKEAISSAKERISKVNKAKVSAEKLESYKGVEGPEQLRTKIAQEPPVETSSAETSMLAPQECDPASPNVSSHLGNSAPSAEIKVSHETATECLTCENLIHCDIRSNSPAKSIRKAQNGTSCRLATELSSK